MKELTDKQREILDYLGVHFQSHGNWPSVREIQAHFDYKSTNAVMGHLRALHKKGVIDRERGQARSFRIQGMEEFTPNTSNVVSFDGVMSVPIYGDIAAGYPDHVESGSSLGALQIDVSSSGVRQRNQAFALRVTGQSMIDAGIYEGDLVILEKIQAKHEDIVAALIDEETTLKRYMSPRGMDPYLKAENPNYPDLIPVQTLMVQGVARSIVRTF